MSAFRPPGPVAMGSTARAPPCGRRSAPAASLRRRRKSRGEGEARRRWLHPRWGCCSLAAAVAAFFLLRGPGQVAVPDLVGEQLADAEPQLEQAGFEVEVEKEEDEAPINEVIEQDPRPTSRPTRAPR